MSNEQRKGARTSGPRIRLKGRPKWVDWKRPFFMSVGIALFCIVYFAPPFPAAVDPAGEQFHLTDEGKTALGLFLLAATWWVFEVVPIGVTGITIGVVQVLFLIRPSKVVTRVIEGDVDKGSEITGVVSEELSAAKVAFGDFMDPSVWFIIGSIVFGMVFTKTGLTNRLAYRMLAVVGERTSMIYLGCFVTTAALTLIMAHTAAAATMYPLLMAIYALYTDDREPTRFGKGLFIGMAFVAGAGSIITLLGAARGAVAIGFYREIVEDGDISFFELTYYMLPVGCIMVVLLWLYCMIVFKPERKTIPGLRERAKSLHAKLGPMSRNEIVALIIILAAITVMGSRQFVPEELGQHLHKSAVILTATILFFIFKILEPKDLEEIPWNIVLLFGGAMSIGFCLWETGAAEWMAIQWLVVFEGAPWYVFVVGTAFFVMVMTNLIMNVAAIAISLPVALVIAQKLGVAPEIVLFSSLVAAGMPFLLLVGAAPNAIAYESKQFTSGEFFLYGIPASIVLMIVVAIFVLTVWPHMMGMPFQLEEERTEADDKRENLQTPEVGVRGADRSSPRANSARGRCPMVRAGRSVGGVALVA